VDPEAIRRTDPARYLDLGRATVAQLVTNVLAEWRRSGSGCDGALIFTWRDLWPGAGWGILDEGGRPKAPWYAARRVLQPVALLATDEGLNGLDLHVVNDTASPLTATLVVELFPPGRPNGERADCLVEVAPRDAIVIRADSLFDGFRDITYAYRFGPPAHDAVVATLTSADGELGTVVYLPQGEARPVVADLGLTAVAYEDGDGRWSLRIHTDALAQWVAIHVPGFRPNDSWFHLPAGSTREIALFRTTSAEDRAPEGDVRALNCGTAAIMTIDR
jgi:beta-mannosidase